MTKYVVDASFIIKAILTQETGVARIFKKIFDQVGMGQAQVYAPELLRIEVSNSLRYTLANFDEAEIPYQSFALLPIKFLPMTDKDLLEIISLSYNMGTTVYDTSYHFLAQSLGGTFLTCDREYFQKAKKLGGIELA